MKRVVQLFALTSLVLAAVGCGSGGDDIKTPEVVKMGRDSGGAKKPADKPADAKPGDATKPGAKPADAKPADAKPADAKPADAKPADAKPGATKGP